PVLRDARGLNGYQRGSVWRRVAMRPDSMDRTPATSGYGSIPQNGLGMEDLLNNASGVAKKLKEIG
ncbi:MAG TPA: hypothetical protein VKP69_03950, partial [Isosphaeraceae bacterium]|nr:hypothetical protein [Isosphaeraceae bacterium]